MRDFLDLKRLWLDATTENDINIVQRFSYFLAFFGITTFLSFLLVSTLGLMYLFYEMFIPVIWSLSLFGWLFISFVFAVGTRLYQGYRGRAVLVEEEDDDFYEMAAIYHQDEEEPVAYSPGPKKEREEENGL